MNRRFSSTADLLAYWGARQPPAFFVHPARQPEILDAFRNICPAGAEKRIIDAADKACVHTFDLLGSGDFKFNGNIDWHLDFKSGHRFDPHQYYADVKPAPYPGGYDIKVPWELSRCQHFAWLGEAYWLTDDERYAAEYVRQVEDWIDKNPPQRGVNWACTMDVAIRVVNWLWGYAFIESSTALTPFFIKVFLKSLLSHGRHIMANLERSLTLTSNHYLADLAGLVYLGCLLPEFKEAQTWREFGLSEIEAEMEKQVLPDGVDDESSTAYHRLVTEMFLSVTLLGQLHGHVFSQAYIDRLEKMFEYILFLTRADGKVVLIGDNDNGRLHRLGIPLQKEREWNDFRYLLAAAACLFDRLDFAQAAVDVGQDAVGQDAVGQDAVGQDAAGQDAVWQEAVWLCGETAVAWRRKAAEQIQPVRIPSRLFPHAGMAVLREADQMMNVHAGGVGLNGLGAHAHNDALGIELFGEGIAWIKDPGSGMYTGDYKVRDRFRSSALHSGAMIDGMEINRFDEKAPFRMGEDAHAQVEKWISNEDYDILIASHTGYMRLAQPVKHLRVVYFQKIKRFWIVQDIFSGTGEHDIDLCMHFGDVAVISGEAEHVRLSANGDNPPHLHILPISPGRMDLQMVEAECAEGYGAWHTTPCARYHVRRDLPFENKFFLTITSPGTDMDFSALRDLATQAWQEFGLFGLNTI